ncbi:hypothetical protein XPA_003016 [Xanthoria parietina]
MQKSPSDLEHSTVALYFRAFDYSTSYSSCNSELCETLHFITAFHILASSNASDMLSRGNSEASARLRRAKSSASIKTRRSLPTEPDVPDPFVAKEQALAAAFHAYGRANASELPSGASFESSSQYRHLNVEQPLTRSKSIRFAGPTAMPAQGVPMTKRATPTTHVDHETRRRSLHPRLRHRTSSIQADDAFMTALPSHGEYVETRVASQPSSYRRLRKSKSMFNPGLWSNASVSSASRNQPKHPSDCTGQQDGSRLGRSLSFLRPSIERSQSQATVSNAAQSEAIGLARDQYFRHLEQQKSNNQPSYAHTLDRRRSQKTFRKSVRTSSANSYGSAVGSAPSFAGPQTGRMGIGGRARDLSSTFKNRFKRVFNRSSDEGGTFPAQQLRATRPHFGDPATSFASSSYPQDSAAESLRKDEIGLPDLERANSLYVPRRRSSLAGNVHNTGGELNEETAHSRVTSWTDSTAANTVSSKHDSGSNRLSIIQENGGVLPRPGALPQTEAGSQSQRRKTSLFAKLQQRMAKSNSVVASEPAHDMSSDTSNRLLTGPETTSSGHMSEPHRRLHSNPYRSDLLTAVTSDHTSSTNALQHGNPTQCAPTVRTDALREVAKEPSPKRPLRESKSTFFPQSTRIERTRTSPFRQAMQSSGRADRGRGIDSLSSPLDTSEEVSYSPEAKGFRDRSLTRSESIYSRTSSGDTPQPLDSLSDLAQMQAGWERHMATIAPKISLEDRTRASTAETNTAREIGHRREHAEISGTDTDLGRLHLSTPMLQDSLASRRTGVDTRRSTSYTSSQPMNDRFPLMSINPRSNTSNVQHKPLDNPRKVTANTKENENCHPANRPDKGAENSTGQRLGPGPSSTRTSPKGRLVQHSPSPNDRLSLYATPVKVGLLPTSSPSSHNRSSPERIARLRRMQSNYRMGSPNARKSSRAPSRPRQLMAESGSHDSQDPKRDNSVHKGGSQKDAMDLSSGGSKMVDLFLSNRMDTSSDTGDDIVFI